MTIPYDVDAGFLASGAQFYVAPDALVAPLSSTIPTSITTPYVAQGRIMSCEWDGPKVNPIKMKVPINATSGRERKRPGLQDYGSCKLSIKYNAADYATFLAQNGLMKWFLVQFPDGPTVATPLVSGSILQLKGIFNGPSMKMPGREEEIMADVTIDVDDYLFTGATYS